MLTLEQARFVIRHEREKDIFLFNVYKQFTVNGQAAVVDVDTFSSIHPMHYLRSGFLEVDTQYTTTFTLSTLFDFVKLFHKEYGELRPVVAIISREKNFFSNTENLIRVIFEMTGEKEEEISITTEVDEVNVNTRNIRIKFIQSLDVNAIQPKMLGRQFDLIISINHYPVDMAAFSKKGLVVFVKRKIHDYISKTNTFFDSDI